MAYARYPADPRVRREAEALARAGFEVDVISLRGRDELREEVVAGVRVTRLPLVAIRGSRAQYLYQYLTFLLLAAMELTRRQMRARYRVVHVHSLPDFLILAALPSRFLGAHLVLDLHESMPELYLARFRGRRASLFHRLTVAAQYISCTLASEIVTVNESIQGILKQLGVAEHRIVIVENAPDWQLSRASDSDGPVNPVPQFVIVGGLNPERDIENVVRAAARVHDSFPARWRIVGHGDQAYIDRLRKLARHLGLEDVLTIEPEVPAIAVPGLLRETMVGIVSYEKNPLTEIATPNKAYEYAALGKPMVVADLPGLRRLLGDAATYYEPGNFGSLARAITKLLEDGRLREDLGRKAEQVHSEHAWSRMAERLVLMYEDLLGARPSWATGRR